VNHALAGAGLGFLFSSGAAIAVASSPPMRRSRLDERLAPYLADAPRPSRLLAAGRAPAGPWVRRPLTERAFRPLLRRAARAVDRGLGGTPSVRRRLDQAGSVLSVEQFRVEQVIWGAAGLLGGMSLALMAAIRGGSIPSAAFLVLSIALMSGGVLARDRALTREVSRREQRMLAEFPTIAELLALSVGAGEGAAGALERITRLSHGELARELGRALADARAGAPLVAALESLTRRTQLPALARFVDGVVIAVERGTPLAEVLRAQAVDVREQSRRTLLESGARKEVVMLVPVVFLVLPVTIVFALLPGFTSLSLAVP
jgi:tight adherence protein C